MIRLMTYNLGAYNKKHLALAINVIKDENPAILVLNEASWLGRTQKSLQELSKNLELPFAHLAKSTRSSNHVAILSKYHLADVAAVQGLQNAGIIAVVETKIGDISLAGIHLAPSTEDTRLAEIRSVISGLKNNPMKVILGDLNSVASENRVRSKNLSDVPKESVRHEVIEYIKRTGFQDVAVTKHMEQISTVPITKDGDVEYYDLRLDYIFLSDSLARKAIDYKVIINETTRLCSDHFPLVVDVDDKTPTE